MNCQYEFDRLEEEKKGIAGGETGRWTVGLTLIQSPYSLLIQHTAAFIPLQSDATRIFIV